MEGKEVKYIAWLILLTGVAHGGERTMCHLEPADVAGGWHYRTKVPPLMDAQCWYVGERMKPRRELYWAEVPDIPPPEIPPMSIMESERETEFDQRWRGIPTDAGR
jgi:hypothetical protein